MKLAELVWAQPKSKIKAGLGLETGDYPFYTSSPVLTKAYDEYQFEGPALIFGTGGIPSIHYTKERFSTSTDCLVFYPKNADVNLKLLYTYLDSMPHVLEEGFKGAGLKHISKKYILDIELPFLDFKSDFPGLAVLDVIRQMVASHKETIEKLDELVKSRFVEMFGDPETNPLGWDTTTIGELATDVRYGTSKPARNDGPFTYLRMNNMTYEGKLDLSDTKTISLDGKDLENAKVVKGDLLFNRTNSREHVGKTCVFNLDESMVIAGYIIRVRLCNKVIPEYVSAFLNSPYGKRMLKSMAHGAVNQANINAKEMQSIVLPVPPRNLQDDYLAFVHQVDKLKLAVQQSIDKLQELYDSLAQEYFGGDCE